MSKRARIVKQGDLEHAEPWVDELKDDKDDTSNVITREVWVPSKQYTHLRALLSKK